MYKELICSFGLAGILLSTQSLKGQSPGGVPAAAWYRADILSNLYTDNGTTQVSDNSPVYRWNETTGKGFNFLQASAGARPVYSNATTLANFNPTLTFDGSNDFMQFTAGTGINIIDRADGSLYAAGFMNVQKRNGLLGFHSSMDYPGLHTYAANFNLLFFTGGPGYQGQSAAPMAARSFFTVGAGWKNGAGASAAYAGATVSLNGNRIDYTGSQLQNANLSTGARDLRIGGDDNYGAFSGQLNEILVFEDKLTIAQMDQVETYLAIKYGTTYASGTRDYKSSTSATVWNAAANAGWNYNIAGIGRDNNGALYQKQSWSTNEGRQVLIGVGTLANTNATNSGSLTDGQYLIWGDNGLAKTATVAITGITGISHRFAATWKVQNSGAVGTVRVAWPKSLINLKLIQSADAIFNASDIVSDMSANETTINGIIYNYVDVILSNGQYFTFGAKVPSPGGVVDGLLMWHKADDGVVTAGAKNKWQDVSGNGRDVTQNNNASYQPLLVTANAYKADNKTYSFNFNPFYYFDGTNDFFYREGDLYFPSVNSPGSAYGVMFNSNRGGWNTPYGWADDDPNFFRWDERYELWRENGRALMTTDMDARTLPANIGGMSWRGNGINGVYLNINGKTYSSTTTHIGTLNDNRNPPNFAIGSEGHNVQASGNEQFQGGMSEVFAYSVDHQNSGGTEKQRINSYLAVKYGITLKSEDGTTVPDYLNSAAAVVWSAAANAGYNNNIAGLARDESSALHQKQSQSNGNGQQVIIGTTGLANTNAMNAVGLSEGQWLIWGDNGLSRSPSLAFNFPSRPALNLRFPAIWKVQVTSAAPTVRVAWPQGIPNLHLIQSSDNVFDDTDVFTDMTPNTVTINGVGYNYADVTLANGSYFTFAGYLIGPGGVGGAVVWLQANAGTNTTIDSADVSSWDNLGSSGGSAGQLLTYNLPFFKNAVHNFNPALVDATIDAHGSMVLTNVFPANAHRPLSTFVLQSHPDVASERTIVTYGTTANSAGAYEAPWFLTSTTRLPRLFWQDNFVQTAPINGITRINNIPAINSYYMPQWVSNPYTATLSLNGATGPVTGNVNASRPIGSHLYINSDGGSNNLSGGITSEIISYGRDLSTVEKQQVNSYLAIKYGITLLADNGLSVNNYLNSTAGVVWDITINNGYNNNIGGIGRDDLGSLYQKQSMSVNPGRQVLISTTGLANTNAANMGTISNNQYLVWGDNNLAKGPTVNITGVPDINKRFAAIWKVQNTGNTGTVRVAWPSGLTNMKLVQSPDAVFDATDIFTDMTGKQVVNGIEYAYADVTLNNGQYFTFAAYVQAPGGVTNGLSHWYRADKLTESAGTGTSLVKWTDFTSGVVAAQLGTGALPQFKTGDSAYFNFNPGINFTNTNQSLGNITESTLSSTDFDIFTLTKEGMSGTRFFNIGMNNTTLNGTNWDQPGLYTNGTIARRDNTGGSLGAPNPGNINFLTNVSSIMYHRFTNTSMSKGLNGDAMGATYTHTVRGPMTGGFMFGSNAVDVAGGDDAGFTGNIGELIIYGNGAITPAERNKVDAYLAIKYGITLQNSNNYTTSQDVVVWNAAANTGYYNNVAGIGYDFNSALLQKQSRSQHPNTNGQVIIGLGEIAPTNEANAGTIADGKFLVWGDNGNTQAMTNTAGTYTAFSYAGSINNGRRMNRVWKVQNTGITGQLLIRFPQASVGTTTLANDGCADYAIIFANDAAFTTNVSAVALTLNGTNYEAVHNFPNGASYFTFGRVTPLSTGNVYLPANVETTGEYNNNCGTGEFTYFNKTGNARQKLLGVSGVSAPQLNNLQVSITPEGVGYNNGSAHITNLMPRIASIVDNNASPVSAGKLRVYYSADEMNATIVPGAVTSGWFRYNGNADDVITDVYEDGRFTTGKAQAIAPDASGVEDGILYVEFYNVPLGASFVYLSSTENLNNVLPVTLLSFTANAGKSTVTLKWATASEQNNKGFEIERSADGNNWSRIDFVASRSVNGNSSSREDYVYVDKAPAADRNYYRLKQINFDGGYTYSAVAMVRFSSSLNITIAPNPVHNELRIEGLNGKNRIDIINSAGLVVRSVSVEKEQTILINMSRFVPGVYFLSIQNEDGLFSRHKILKK